MVRRWSWAVALVAVAASGGCGGGQSPSQSRGAAAEPVGKSSAGSVVQFADCGDWRGGSRASRMVTVEHLRRQLTPQRSKTAESPLADDRAYALLDRACRPAYAESLRLYKLYVRMQGFAPLSQ
jgi:hypothetical protein